MDERAQEAHLSPRVWNVVSGRVISILRGLTRTTIQVMIEDQATVRFRCASEFFEHAGFHIGQQVIARIPAEGVLLGTVGSWPGNNRWNRWGGRIVLVEPGESTPMITVKLQGKSWTLKSTGPVVGQRLRPQVWEPVNIVIDPEKVTLVPQLVANIWRSWAVQSIQTAGSHPVWLRARIEAVCTGAQGSVVSLDVGGAHVSALICREEAQCEWAPGLPVEIHVGQWEAWLRPEGDRTDPIFCRLIY